MALKNKIGLMVVGMALLSVGLGTNVSAIEFDGGAPDTGVLTNGLSNVAASLPVFGVILVATGVVAFVLSKRK